MASYDIFTHIPTPAIPISLFADAATAGINAGKALPTDTTAVIQGAIQGYQTGQDITAKNQLIQATEQQNIIRQNQIEHLSVADEIQQTQLENTQKINEINALRLKIEQDTYQYKIQNELDTLKNQAAEFEEAKRIRTTKERISQYLVDPDPQVRRKILQDPDAMDLIINSSKYGEGVLGRLAATGTFTKEEEDNLFKQINYTRAKELEIEIQKASNNLLMKELQKFDKLEEEVNASPQINNTLAAAGYKSYTDLIDRDYIAVPTGSVSYIKDEKTGEPTNVVDKYMTIKPYDTTGTTGKPVSYDIIIDGVKSPIPMSSEDEVAKLNKIINLSRSKFGMSAARAAEKEAPYTPVQQSSTSEQTPPYTPVQQSSTSVQTTSKIDSKEDTILENIITSLEAEGLPRKEVTDFLAKVKIEAISSDSWTDDLLNVFSAEGAANIIFSKSGDEVRKLNKTIDTVAETKTQQVLSIMRGKDSAKKQDIRDWMEANNVKSWDLTPYFANQLRTRVAEAYFQTKEIGNEQQQKAARLAAAEERTKNRLKELPLQKIVGAVDNFQASATNVTPKPDSAPNPEAQAAAISDVATKADISNEASLVQTAADEAQTAKNIMRESLPKQNILETLDTKLNTLRVRYGLPKDFVADMRVIVTRIEKDGYLKNQDSYVKALAAVEGSGRMNKISKTGVRGPLQVTKLVADMYKKDRYDPQENIEAGALYIEDLFKQFKGSKALAYAAYNAGPGVIRHAQKLAGGSSVWIDLKPYLLKSLTRFREEGGWKPSEKLKEVYNYPEKVMLYEEIFQGSIPDTGVIT